jgi:hypothetical protein
MSFTNGSAALPLEDVLGREAEARELVLRQVHAPAARVLAHVADDVGELEGDAQGLRVLEGRCFGIPEDRRGELAHHSPPRDGNRA